MNLDNVKEIRLGTTKVNLCLGNDIMYKELDYIRSTGNLYIPTTDIISPWSINTDYGFWDDNAIYTIKIKYNVNSSQNTGSGEGNKQHALLSICSDYGPTIYCNNNSGVFWKFPQSAWDYYFTPINPSVGQSTRQVSLSNFNTITESTVSYSCKDGSNKDAYKSYGIVLFGRAGGVPSGDLNITSTDRLIKADLYYCLIYKNGELLLDFIPVETFKGDIGLYDKVHHKFIKSYEGTPFQAGYKN